MRGRGSIPTGVNIFTGIFLFSHIKVSAVNIAIIEILVHFENTLMIYAVGGIFENDIL